MTGAWLEYVIEDKTLQKTADSLGYDHSLHITICYFGRNLRHETYVTAYQIIGRWVKFFPKRFEVRPLGLLTQFEDVTVQEVTVPERIRDRRRILLTDLYLNGIKYHDDFDWNPHITLGKDDGKILFAPNRDRILIKRIKFHNDFSELDEWSLE